MIRFSGGINYREFFDGDFSWDYSIWVSPKISNIHSMVNHSLARKEATSTGFVCRSTGARYKFPAFGYCRLLNVLWWVWYPSEVMMAIIVLRKAFCALWIICQFEAIVVRKWGQISSPSDVQLLLACISLLAFWTWHVSIGSNQCDN